MVVLLMRNIVKNLKVVMASLQHMYEASPTYFIIDIIAGVFQSILILLEIVALQTFFDTAANFVDNASTFAALTTSLIILMGVYLVKQLANGVHNHIFVIFNRKSGGLAILKMIRKFSIISSERFEDTSQLEKYNKVQKGASLIAPFALTITALFSLYTLAFVSVSWYLYQLNPLFIFSLVCIFIPSVISQLLRVSLFRKLENKSVSLRRQVNYYEKCLADKKYYMETRLLGCTSYFKNNYKKSMTELNKLILKTGLIKNFWTLLLNLLTALGYLLILFMLVDSVLRQQISLGAFSAVFASVARLYRLMDELIERRIGQAVNDFFGIENYFSFLNEEIQDKEKRPGKIKDIILRNVSYIYPDGNQIIHDIDLTIKSGESLAIVGVNGSGKTTLCRLISGLYMPSNGDVLYGNVSTKEIKQDWLHKNTTAIFQNYGKYSMTLKENICISKLEKPCNNADLDKVCHQASICMANSLPNGYETLLGREFGGVDISGGQWQRIGIARAIYKDHKLAIFDEPTAAIDPIEESKIYDDFQEISKNKTSILVTHRLASVKTMDRIVVMKSGKIVQNGTHEELMNVAGEYKKMYQSQMAWYG